MHISKLVTGKKSLLIGIAGLIVVIAVLELTNTTHIFHKQKVLPVITAHTNSGKLINSTNGASTKPNDSNNGSPASTNSGTSPTAADSDHTLIAPFGDFVSNHYPGQNGSSDTESSVCNTSPGATCYIKFTNGDQVTQLPSQVTDAHGSTSWYWDIHKDAHLFSGQWQVTAVATLGSQVKSTDDPLKLTIQ